MTFKRKDTLYWDTCDWLQLIPKAPVHPDWVMAKSTIRPERLIIYVRLQSNNFALFFYKNCFLTLAPRPVVVEYLTSEMCGIGFITSKGQKFFHCWNAVITSLDNYATFGLLFVSVKVSVYIALLNLFLRSLSQAFKCYINRVWLTQRCDSGTDRVGTKSLLLVRANHLFFNSLLLPLGIMWKAVLLAGCLLAAGVQPMVDPTYGVKLCGREFIRAVIFTCGGSRWRRSLMSAGEGFKFESSTPLPLLNSKE